MIVGVVSLVIMARRGADLVSAQRFHAKRCRLFFATSPGGAQAQEAVGALAAADPGAAGGEPEAAGPCQPVRWLQGP